MIASFFFFLTVGTAVYFIFAGFKYTRMISNIFLSLVYKPVIEEPGPVQGERITILDSAEHEIEALYLHRPRAKKAVIFCHESGATKESWEKYAYFLPSIGYHIVSLDFNKPTVPDEERNSLAQWPAENDVSRLLTVVRWARKVFRPGTAVVLFGVSNGADIAFAAATRDSSIKAVIADGLFSMKEIFRDYIRKWAPILVRPNLFGEHYPAWVVNIFTNLGFWYSQKRAHRRFVDIERFLGKSHPPLLMIHGENDDYIPDGHQKFLQRKNRGQLSVRHLVVPKAGHNQAVVVDREIYETHITEFLESLA